jgi:hypothetical protein
MVNLEFMQNVQVDSFPDFVHFARLVFPNHGFEFFHDVRHQ